MISLALVIALLATFSACKKSSIAEDSFYSDYDELPEITQQEDGETGTDSNEQGSNKGSGKSKTKNNSSGNNGGSTSNNDYNPYTDLTSKYKGKTVRILTWWTISSKSNAFEQAVIDKMKKELGITLKVVTTTQELYQTKLTSMIASNDSPDLAFMDSTSFPIMILKNKVVPLDTNIIDLKNDKEISVSTMDNFKWDGKYYGINCMGNWQGGPYLLYYNKTAIRQKGYKTPYELYKAGKWNWDTFAELAKNMTDKTKNYYGFGCEDPDQVAFLDSIRTDFVKYSGTTIINNLDDPNLTKVLTFLSNLRANGYMAPENNGGASDKRAMTVKGTWAMQSSQADSMWGDSCEAVPVPSPAGQKQVIASDARVLCVCRGSKNPEAALYAARYFLDPDNYDMNSEIRSQQLREMFKITTSSDQIFSGTGRGVASYNGEEQFWKLLWLTRESAADIPVALKSSKNVIDGAISKINEDIKAFN